MDSGILFVVALGVLALVAILIEFKSLPKAVNYLKTAEGKKVLSGIVLFTGFGILIVLLSTAARAEEPKGTWFAYSEVFLGLDYTRGQSPQCYGGPNDIATSNGGLRQNIYLSADRRFHLNAKYTHHSCAFAPDRQNYDAIGVELTYRFYSR